MFVMVAEIKSKPGSRAAFEDRIDRQAHQGRALEKRCLQFDVCVDEAESTRDLVYEVCTDAAAFDAHRQTPHCAQFASAVSRWWRDANSGGSGGVSRLAVDPGGGTPRGGSRFPLATAYDSLTLSQQQAPGLHGRDRGKGHAATSVRSVAAVI